MVDTTEERGPLMLMLMPTMDSDTLMPIAMAMLPPTTALVTTLARGLLMLNPDTSEDIMEDTVVMDMVDAEDTTLLNYFMMPALCESFGFQQINFS